MVPVIALSCLFDIMFMYFCKDKCSNCKATRCIYEGLVERLFLEMPETGSESDTLLSGKAKVFKNYSGFYRNRNKKNK